MDEVNRLLKEGWALLSVRDAPDDPRFEGAFRYALGKTEPQQAAASDKIPCFTYQDYMETDKAYAYLYGLKGKVGELRWAQIYARMKYDAETTDEELQGNFDTLYQAYEHDTECGVPDAEQGEDAATLDCETRLRMIAEAVDGMTRKDWQDASHKISRLFDYPATVAGNRVTIGRTADEIMNTLKQDF